MPVRNLTKLRYFNYAYGFAWATRVKASCVAKTVQWTYLGVKLRWAV